MASGCLAVDVEILKFGKYQQNSVQLLLSAFKACSETRNLERGRLLQVEAITCGYGCNIYVANALITMYAKCGSMADSWEVFKGIKQPTVVSWTALILGYANNGQGHMALDFFTRMRDEGPAPNSVTIVGALKAFTSIAVNEGAMTWVECSDSAKRLHNIAVENGCNTYVENTLIDLYAKSGSMPDAHDAFHGMKHRNIVSWNALILGYAVNGQSRISLDLFIRMRTEGFAPDFVTLVAALQACTSLAVKEVRRFGKEVHNIAVEAGCNANVYVQSTLVDMYAKCGSMADARDVFEGIKIPTVVSWNALILGYADNGQHFTSLNLFIRMRTEGPDLDFVTLGAAIAACASFAANEGSANSIDRGKALHNIAVESSCNSVVYVQKALINMYSKCDSMMNAREVFDSMGHPDVASWTALILGYADNGQAHTALNLFTSMKAKGVMPDVVSFLTGLKACSLAGALEFGRTIHLELCKTGKDLDVVIVNCLVDFYAKCGSLKEAQNIFDLHAETRNVITWNALLAGFSNYGDSEAVFELFQRMQESFRPDGATFLCILTCCSHGGLVKKGKECFDSMSSNFQVNPTIDHYNCMVDIFGRANKLDNVIAFLGNMPCIPNEVTWKTILSACCKWENVEIGRVAINSLIDLERNAHAYASLH